MDGRRVFPIISATFNLTQSCNLRCGYCFTYGKSEKRMTKETAEKCVNFLVKNALEADARDCNGGKKMVDISAWGGEPLLEWDLFKHIVLYTKSILPRGVSANFGGTTNGVLLTKEKIDFLAEHGISFMVSFDGTPETHDQYRIDRFGQGSHAIILNNMEELHKRSLFYKVRVSLYPDRAAYFYEDVKFLVEHGMYSIMFSPVYEHGWTEENWSTWVKQSRKIVDLIAEYKNKGIKIDIDHFKSYVNVDQSRWPCGAGRFYVGFDTDGSIWPCHRFIKFGDGREWFQKEMCIGHVDQGITKPEVRQRFIDYKPLNCTNCEFDKTTPCHGGCYGVNFDLTGSIDTPYPALCEYVSVQKTVSMYYKEKVGVEEFMRGARSCICYNMCYMEGTNEEIVNVDETDKHCHCYNANYTGSTDTDKVARIIKAKRVNPLEVLRKLEKMEARLDSMEQKLNMLDKIV